MSALFNMTSLWLIICIAAAVIEIATASSLVSIWFAAGAFFAMLAAAADAPVFLQWVIFAAVSFAALLFFRKKAMQHIVRKKVATNADRAIGQEGRVTETIDNLAETGAVSLDGQVWTARTEKDNEIIDKGTVVTVKRIAGVKLIVAKKKEA